MGKLKVGAGKRKICIPEKYLAAENFVMIHDDIHARVIIIRDEITIMIASLEITSIQETEVNELRNFLSEQTGIKAENIWICATHSFSSPHLLPDEILGTEEKIGLKKQYFAAIRQALSEAADEAYHHLEPARAGVNTGICDIVGNRDIELEEGWWVGTGGTGMTDQTVTVLRFDDMKNHTIALITHFSMQSSVLDQSELEAGGKAVTSDVAGNACRMVEERCDDKVTAMYLIGAAGDQGPTEKAVSEVFTEGKRVRTDVHERGFEICERFSQKLGNTICRIAEETICEEENLCLQTGRIKVTVPGKKMERNLHKLTPVHTMIYEQDEERVITIEAIGMGKTGLIGVQPELNCVTAASIMEKSRFQNTLICTMVNGASKYMADAASYDSYRYEALNSPFGKGAAEIVSEKAAELLNQL